MLSSTAVHRPVLQHAIATYIKVTCMLYLCQLAHHSVMLDLHTEDSRRSLSLTSQKGRLIMIVAGRILRLFDAFALHAKTHVSCLVKDVCTDSNRQQVSGRNELTG